MGETITIVIILAIAAGGFIFLTRYLPALIQNAQAQQSTGTSPASNGCILDNTTQTYLLTGTMTPCDPSTGLAIPNTANGSTSKTTGGSNCPSSCSCICSGGKPVCKGNSGCSCQGNCSGTKSKSSGAGVGGGATVKATLKSSPTVRHPLGGIIPGLGSVARAPAPVSNPHPLGHIIPGLGLDARAYSFDRMSN